VKDIDFEKSQIIVRDGKGAQDRISMLPERVLESLKRISSMLKISTNKICEMALGVLNYPMHCRVNIRIQIEIGSGNLFSHEKIRSQGKADGIVRRCHVSPATVQKAVRSRKN
jgi:integrase